MTPDPARCGFEHPEGPKSCELALEGPLCAFEHPEGGGWAAMGALADRQHGCVHRRQLLAAGIGRKSISVRIGQGGLYPLARAVYLLGRPPAGTLARLMAAVLQQGGHAVCSHLSAGLVWGITDGLLAAGQRVMRVTARHIDHTPFAAVARLSAALARTAERSRPGVD